MFSSRETLGSSASGSSSWEPDETLWPLGSAGATGGVRPAQTSAPVSQTVMKTFENRNMVNPCFQDDAAMARTEDLAETFHKNYEVHHCGNSLNHAANFRVVVAIRNRQVLRGAAAGRHPEDTRLAEDIEVDGRGSRPRAERPGLGALIDFDLIERRKDHRPALSWTPAGERRGGLPARRRGGATTPGPARRRPPPAG